MFLVFLCELWTAVVETQGHLVVFDAASGDDLATLRGELEGVAQQVGDDFFEVCRIHHHRQFFLAMLDVEGNVLHLGNSFELFEHRTGVLHVVVFFQV